MKVAPWIRVIFAIGPSESSVELGSEGEGAVALRSNYSSGESV